MPFYQYGFGFESPRQFHNNAVHGWDDEDSQGVLIEAEDEAEALAWGQEISERFIKLLFSDESMSWKQHGYANGIEPMTESWPGRQTVAAGSFPDFSAWLQKYEDRA